MNEKITKSNDRLRALKDFSELNLEPNVIEANSTENLSESAIAQMFKQIDLAGFAIVELKSKNHKENLLNISKYLGSVIKHEHSDKNGIVPVQPNENSPGYVNTTATELPLHTDGSFALDPPKIVALQCEVTVARGGLTTIGDGKLLYDFLAGTNPRGLLNLFEPDTMTVQREKRKSTKPIFEECGGITRIRFRWDDAVKISIKPEDLATIETIKSFLRKPENMLQFKLKPGQILIMDNARILHGRTAFNKGEKRHLNRIWFDGKSDCSQKFNFGFYPGKTLEELKKEFCV